MLKEMSVSVGLLVNLHCAVAEISGTVLGRDTDLGIKLPVEKDQ